MSKTDVFISHSIKDKAVADALCHHLEEQNIRCWIAPRDLEMGVKRAVSVNKAIKNSKIFMVVFSSAANMSSDVLSEVELAVKNSLTVVPIRIEDIAPSGGMEYYLSTVHWIDLMDNRAAKRMDEVCEVVKFQLGGANMLSNNNDDDSDYSQGDDTGKKSFAWLYVLAAVVILAGVLLYAFKGSIFKSQDASMNAAEVTKAPTEYISPEPTPAPTVQVTAEPTATPLVDINTISMDTVVNIPDEVLKGKLYEILEKQGNTVEGDITFADMLKLKEIGIISTLEHDQFSECYEGYDYIPCEKKIRTLEGLQYAQNLEILIVADLGVSDISALNQISTLKYFDMRLNNISTLEPIAGNTNLEAAIFDNNRVRNLEPLTNLQNLTQLIPGGNPVESIEPILGLHKLSQLSVFHINCSDIDRIKEMTWLDAVNIEYSGITDLEAFLNFYRLDHIGISADMEKDNLETIQQLRDEGCYVDVQNWE